MTNKEITKIVKNKKIPLSFLFDNGVRYFLFLINDTYMCSSFSGYGYFPHWEPEDLDNYYELGFYNDGYVEPFDVYNGRCNTFEQCLTEFYYWWEINKHRCTEVTYYNTKKEFLDYVIRGNIPLSFTWEDGNEYHLLYGTTEFSTAGYIFPDIDKANYITSFIIYYDAEKTLIDFKRLIFERCYLKFAFWWNKNKHKCTNIEYYK